MDNSPYVDIESFADPRLTPYRDLRHRDPAYDSACFIAEGRLVVERLLKSSLECQSLLVERGHHPDLVEIALARNPQVKIFSTDLRMLREWVGYDFHRGIMACGVRPPIRSIRELPSLAVDSSPLLVACGVNNPENIGGLMRTAAAFGMNRMAITADVADPYSRRALRVSMAAPFRLQIWKMDDPLVDCLFLQQGEGLGFRTVASTLDPRAISIQKWVRDHRPLAILVGSEGDGLPSTLVDQASDRVIIPMAAGTDSLNVNVATAIFLYELLPR